MRQVIQTGDTLVRNVRFFPKIFGGRRSCDKLRDIWPDLESGQYRGGALQLLYVSRFDLSCVYAANQLLAGIICAGCSESGARIGCAL